MFFNDHLSKTSFWAQKTEHSLQSPDTAPSEKSKVIQLKCRKIGTKWVKSFHLPLPALFSVAHAGLAPCWRPHFIPWSHYCLRLRCPCSLWFVGNELAPPCPCSIILIEKVISHSTEQIGEGESVNSNQELTCSQPTVRRGIATLILSRCVWERGVDRRGGRGSEEWQSLTPFFFLENPVLVHPLERKM